MKRKRNVNEQAFSAEDYLNSGDLKQMAVQLFIANYFRRKENE